MIDFELERGINRARLAQQFAQQGYVRIPGFLKKKAAVELANDLSKRGDWNRTLLLDGEARNLPRAAYNALPPENRRKLDLAIYLGARKGFEYRYENIRVPDDEAGREAMNDPLAEFASFMSQGPARDLLRSVIGVDAVDFADAQATLYGPGDFLTGHHDDVEGKNRHAAYVFGLTPNWMLEWGGLLLLHDKDGDVERGLVPAFNTLNIFRVPRMHSVSEVTRAAGHGRLSITGWLRSAPA